MRRRMERTAICAMAIMSASLLMSSAAFAEEQSEATGAAVSEAAGSEETAEDTELVAVSYDAEDPWSSVAITNPDYVTTGVNIRSAADQNSEILGYLYEGTAVWVIEKGDTWTEFYSNGITGYVMNDYLLYGDDAAAAAETYSVEGVRTSWDGVNVYASADTDSAEDTLAADESFQVVSDDGSRVEIEYNGGTAYVANEDVTRVALLASATPKDGERVQLVEDPVRTSDAFDTYYDDTSADSYTGDTYTSETEYVPETSAPETEYVPETSAPETEYVPDTEYVPETSAPETEYVPDTEYVPETSAPETEYVPETSAPETEYVPDTEYVPETSAPETEYVPETSAPETEYVPDTEYVPETSAPETEYVPETSAPETEYVPDTEYVPETSAPETEDTSSSSSDLDLLAALIYCEAGNQPYDGMVAVGAVVMNRVNSSYFPGSISEVIYQSGQFTPASSGALANALANGVPSTCYSAASDAMNGSNPVGSSLYFNTSHGSGIQIGDHWFY